MSGIPGAECAAGSMTRTSNSSSTESLHSSGKYSMPVAGDDKAGGGASRIATMQARTCKLPDKVFHAGLAAMQRKIAATFMSKQASWLSANRRHLEDGRAVTGSRFMELLVFFWLVYFVIHSALASFRAKRWFARCHPNKVRFYRAGFNLVSLILLLPILWQMQRNPGQTWWAWHGWVAWLANGLALAAIAGFLVSLRHYDGKEFLGLRHIQAARSQSGPIDAVHEIHDKDEFRISPFHRYVRHPWYFFSLILIWTRDMNGAMLVSALLLTLYFALGSLLEERKLIAQHGDAYRRYAQRVPGLIPLPWKALPQEEANTLLATAKERKEDVNRLVAGDTHPGL